MSETEEVRERQTAALVRELERARLIGDRDLEKACLHALEGTAYAAKKPAERAEKRPRGRPKKSEERA